MEALRCTIVRGDTSKAVFLREEDLPPPDKRQIDGLGGRLG